MPPFELAAVFQVCARAARAGSRRAAALRVGRSGSAVARVAPCGHRGAAPTASASRVPQSLTRRAPRPPAPALRSWSTFASFARHYSGAERLNNPYAPGDAPTRAPQPLLHAAESLQPRPQSTASSEWPSCRLATASAAVNIAMRLARCVLRCAWPPAAAAALCASQLTRFASPASQFTCCVAPRRRGRDANFHCIHLLALHWWLVLRTQYSVAVHHTFAWARTAPWEGPLTSPIFTSFCC